MLPDLRLFRLFGIQFTASWSWLFLLGLIAYTAEATLDELLPGLPPAVRWGLAVAAALLSVASLYAHELAHALVAIRFGLPVRTISLFLLGGMAHIARDSPSPRAELLIALAGPLTSLAIGFLGAGVSWASWGTVPTLGALTLWLALVNVPVGVFNLVPAYPLDGGRVLRAVVWFAAQDLRWGSLVAARAGQLGAGLLVFAGLYGLFSRTTGAIGSVWLVLLAWFMYAGALAMHRATVLTDVLRGLSVAAVMQRPFGRVRAGLSLQDFAEEYLLQGRDRAQRRSEETAARSYGVYRDEHLVGLVSATSIQRVPAPLWRETTVERAMVSLDAAPHVGPDEPALRALQLLVEEGWDLVPVVAEGQLLGLVSRADLSGALERVGRG